MNTFSILAEKNNLTITENGEVKLNPLSQFEFMTFPLDEKLNIITVDSDTYLGLLLKTHQFNKDLTGVEPFDSELFSNFIQTRIFGSSIEEKIKAGDMDGFDN